MGIAKLNIWVSDTGDPCGTFPGDGEMTILDCKGILRWPCGRYLDPNGNWKPVEEYTNLPFTCGHLEAEVPPGCYWVVAVYKYVEPLPEKIIFNNTTHVGIVEVGCGETACVKLYNPTVKLCWEWLRIGLKMHTVAQSKPLLQPEEVKKIERLVDDLLRPVPPHPHDPILKRILDRLYRAAR